MNPRPLSVTIISWLFIAAGTMGVVYHANEFKPQRPFENDAVWILFVRLMAIVCGVLMLRGSTWGRWLLLLWLVYHVILSVFHSPAQLVMHSLLLAVVAYFLLRSEASVYFRSMASPSKAGEKDTA